MTRCGTPPSSRRFATLLCAALLSAAACRPVAAPTAPAPAYRPSPRAAAFLDTVEQRTFLFFWERSDPRTGLTPDRWPTPSFSSIAAVGYALTAYPIGAERGYVTRPQAAERTLATLRWFWLAPQGADSANVAGYRGFFYHFLDMPTGMRFRDVELSTIDTALLIAGVLFCREYYDRPGDATESAIRAYADSLYRRVDWRWMQLRDSSTISMGWTPKDGMAGYAYMGYNEAMLLYVLALGSPTFPVDSTAWPAYTRTYRWADYYGQPHVNFAPLFGHHYSHVWIDFRGIRDAYMRGRGIDYFENSRRATLAQRAYAIDNPMRWIGYGADVWGLSASDGPADTTFAVAALGGKRRQFYTYAARGAAATEVRDDGTIAPTGAGGSVPFAPEVAIPALIAMRERYGDPLFAQYGFVDAFNPTYSDSGAMKMGRLVPGKGWFDGDYLGIDQGPIVAMIENYRSDLVWKHMRRSPYIRRGLERAGFTGGWLETAR